MSRISAAGIRGTVIDVNGMPILNATVVVDPKTRPLPLDPTNAGFNLFLPPKKHALLGHILSINIQRIVLYFWLGQALAHLAIFLNCSDGRRIHHAQRADDDTGDGIQEDVDRSRPVARIHFVP